jgi:glycosyltransferase involved in cell wall biosynthesis
LSSSLLIGANLKIVPRPIRVLRLIARMNVGGPAIQISGLMQHLPKESFEQLLVTGFCDDGELDFLDSSDFEIPATKVLGFGRSIGGISEIRAFFQIRKLIKEFDPHIVHTHTSKAGVLGRVASLSTFNSQIRIHTFHGHLLHGYFGRFKTHLVILVERFLARFTQKLVAVGERVRDELLAVKIGDLDKFAVISPGLELRALPEREKSQRNLGLQNHQFTVSWVGRLVPIKAPLRILEIARACAHNQAGVRFLIVGDGPLRSEMEELAANENLSIKFLGWQSEIETVLAVTDLMLLTSLNEGMPVSLIEAQLAGIPVISTNIGSVSEVVQNAKSGFCLDYTSSEFAERIYEIANDSILYNQFSAAAKVYAQEHFSLKRLVDDYSDLYRSSINQANS